MKRLSYYDGYFYHHIVIGAKLAREGKYFAWIHKSGSAPEYLGMGRLAKTASWPHKPIEGYYDSEAAALAAAEAYCDSTTGVYCTNQHYSPSGHDVRPSLDKIKTVKEGGWS